MNKSVRYILIAVLFVLLVLVRVVAPKIFYDPLIEYFKNDYLYHPPIYIEKLKLVFNMFLRYALNTVISLIIIWIAFQKREYVKFSAIFYGLAFVILITIFSFLIANDFEGGYRLPFYIRRFIVHPVLLLLLLPAFYYQELKAKKD